MPDGFVPHPDSYLNWLVAEIEEMEGPVDLVGHDWGAAHVSRLVAERPELVRSWAIDCAGLLHADYVWHEAAQTWQTEGAGEQAIELMVGLAKDDLAESLQASGASAELSRTLASGVDAQMGRCILGLYRGGAQPYLSDLGDRLRAMAGPPGLAMVASEDPYVPAELCREAAIGVGLSTYDLIGGSHWWVETHAAAAAAALREHWKKS